MQTRSSVATATRHGSQKPDSGSGAKGEDCEMAGHSAIDNSGALRVEGTMSGSNSRDCMSNAPGLSATSRIRRSARIRGHQGSSAKKEEGRKDRARKRKDPPQQEGQRDKYVLVKILKTDDSGNILHCRKATTDEIENLTRFLLLSRPRRFDDSTSGGFDPTGSGGQTHSNHKHMECTGVSHQGRYFENGRGALGGSDESASQYSARWSST
ncbi:hypothetical protein BSKO_12880 [Bryopsis sp. KO-2023]|nr:hypothetical protein BSKO_12880 [Bryopsis sp. KO-2023]